MTHQPTYDDRISPSCFHAFRNIVTYNPSEVLYEHLQLIYEVLSRNLGIDIHLSEVPTLMLPKRQIRPLTLGWYDPSDKAIVLEPNGCRKTLIHEILHSLSYFTREPQLAELMMKEKELIEGINEYFTGYILYMKYKQCYNFWVGQKYPACNISYERYVRLVGATIKTLVSIQDLAKIYFYDQNVIWSDAYSAFLEKYGLNDFIVNKPRKIESFLLLKQSITKVLGEKAKEFEELLTQAPLEIILNYASIR